MGSSPHLWFCACKTATLGTDVQVCVCPRPHLWICAHVTVGLAQECQVYMGSSPHLWFCSCKTATLRPELQVSDGSLISPVDLCNRNSVLTTRIASLYCPRPHLCIFANRTDCHTSPYGSQTSPVDL